MKKYSLMGKGLAIGIIFLFLGTCIIPSTISEQNYGKNIIWDNYEPPDSCPSELSQYDHVYPFNAQAADDFMFESDMRIDGIQWWGVFNSGTPPWPNPMPFIIIFYADDGTGTMPTGAGMDDPTPTALAIYHFDEVYGQLYGMDDEYGVYNVTLSTPFNATANTKYWIAIQAVLVFPPLWDWRTNGENPDQLHIAVHGNPVVLIQYWTNSWYGDMAFQLMGSPYIPPPPPKPDLNCAGHLSWDKIKPGATATGTIQVWNTGELNSHLNWTVESHPDWGTWTFTPSSGMNLTPEHGTITVNVEVTAPNIKNEEFEGQVKIVNTDNSSDFCIIPVTLTTPLNNDLFYYPFFERLFERLPNAFPILRFLLDFD